MRSWVRGGAALAALVLVLSCTKPKSGSPDDGAIPEDALVLELDGPADDGAAAEAGVDGPVIIGDLAAPSDGADAPATDAPADVTAPPTSDGPIVPQPNGAACAGDEQCATGFCADGVCCGTRCGGTCQACAQARTGKPDGTCAPVTAGLDPDRECPAGTPGQCGNLGGCDGAGACRLQPTTVSCASASCSGSTFTPERHCDGHGQCAPAQSTSCGLFKCGGSGCPSTCYGDGDCVAGTPCINGTCGGKRANGATCSQSAECGSGYCVDGVCCGGACNGTCEACSMAKTGQPDGTCQPIRNGEDPDGDCNDDGAATCGKDGFCDGARACRKYGPSTTCMAASCSVSTFTPARTCDGRGTCSPAAPSSCGLARCNASGCIGTCSGDQDCVSPNTCNGGTCVALKPQGAGCNGNSECTSNHCVDGYCCGTTCGGTCQACSAAKTGGTNGTCAGVKVGTDPDNECATDDPTTCGNDGMCDGQGACRKYGTNTLCDNGSCVGQTANYPRACNGMGACNPPVVQMCNTSTQYCAGASCTPKDPNGSGCTTATHCLSGICEDSVCCAASCGTCRNCTTSSFGMCDFVVDRARDPGTCEGTQWCVAGNCQWAVHWEDNAGNLVTSYTFPLSFKVPGPAETMHYVVNGNQGGLGTATPASNLTVTPSSSEIAVHMNGCTGVTLAGGQKCAIDVWMMPSSPGTHMASLTVSDGAGHSSTLNYTFTGTP